MFRQFLRGNHKRALYQRETLSAPKKGRTRALAALSAVAIALGGALIPATAAQAETPTAAGNGVLALTIVPVDYLTGDPIAEIGHGQHGDKVAYKISYACSVDACLNARVTLSPSQADPYGLAIQQPALAGPASTLLSYESWTRPNGAPDVAPSGNDASGMTFTLGDLAAGASGSMTVQYAIAPFGQPRQVSPSQFYPDGFQIQMTAVASADTAVANVASDAAPVTWRNTVPEPSIQLRDIQNSVKPDTTVSQFIAMGTGAMVFPPGGGVSIAGSSEYVAAGSFGVTMQLPPEAVVIAVPDGGVYDPASHSITWSKGTDSAPSYAAAGGWGVSDQYGWYGNALHYLREVKLSFPAANFPQADANGCNFDATVQVGVEMFATYLDDAKTTKTSSDTGEITIGCYDPFGQANLSKGVSGGAGWSGDNQMILVPASGAPAKTHTWDVVVGNAGNVPAVAVIEDNDLGQANAPVDRITTTAAATIEWELNTGVTGVTNGTNVLAPAGTWFVKAKITSGTIEPSRIKPSDTGTTTFRASFRFSVSSDAPIGQVRTNTASSTVSWPSYPELTPSNRTATRSIVFAAANATITAAFPEAAAVEGGGNAVPGRDTTFKLGGTTQNVPDGSTFTPEYVFIAPAGWVVTPDSASFAGAAPAGVTFQYLTKQVDGVDRQVVVATWPVGTSFASLTTLPTMSVVAQPTFAVAAGTTSVAEGWIGDSARNWTNAEATYTKPKQNTADIDGSGDSSAWFSTETQNVLVSASDAISVVKEICKPSVVAADGCEWISDPNQTVPVPTNATSIKYRISIQNIGNTNLGSVVAYDVLPYIGDTGLTVATAGVPRGSMFNEVLSSVSDVSSNLTLAYSSSTNPSRPEVNPSSGGVDDWDTSASGKQSIRAKVNGTLSPGGIASFTYSAAVVAGAAADGRACNSVALSTNRTLPSEPQPVCATAEEADLEVTGPASIEAQIGRPTTFPFIIENLGGSATAAGKVSVEAPAGVTITGFPNGWTCQVVGGLPVSGPISFECDPPAALAKDNPVPFDLDAIVTAPGASVTVRIDGDIYDPESSNDSHTITVPDVVTAATQIDVVKSDGLEALVVGQEVTYTITATNPLAFEALSGVTIVDAIPTGMEFLSANEGGTVAGTDVIWSLDLAAGESKDVQVTLRVLATAASQVQNIVTASAQDPVFPTEAFEGTASDIDAIDRLTLSKTGLLENDSAPNPGDTVTFTFVATNSGGGVLSGVVIEDLMPGLSDIAINSWPALPGYLGVGQSVTGTATYTLTQADVNSGTLSNTAVATGNSVGGETTSATSSVDLPLPASPAISVTKDASLPQGVPQVGELATYTFTVTNTGNVTLTGIDLSDPLPGLSDVTFTGWPSAAGLLDAGQSVTGTATYPLTQTDIDSGQVDNTATASGNSPAGVPAEGSDSHTLVVLQNASLEFEKVGELVDPDNVLAGDTITYTFTITNNGNVTLDGVEISDQLEGLSDIVIDAWPNTAGVLAPQDTVTASATYTVTQADLDAGRVDNTATASASAPNDAPVSTTDGTTTSLLANAALSLTKEGVAPTGTSFAGDLVTYSFEVENTGNVTISNVSIADELTGLSPISYGDWPGDEGVLKPGERVSAAATYALTQIDLDRGNVDNSATARGTAPGNIPVSGIDADTVQLIAVPAVEFTKDGALSVGTPFAGDRVTYTFEVENTGNVSLTEIEIIDQLPGLSAISYGQWPAAPGELAPGAKVSATAFVTLTQEQIDEGWIHNEAQVGANPVRGSGVQTSAEADVELPGRPGLSVVKLADLADTNGDGFANPGELIHYSFKVTNTGNVTLHDVVVVDPKVQGLSDIESLAPGATITIDAHPYAVTANDASAGTVVNIATATGITPDGSVIESEQSHTSTQAAKAPVASGGLAFTGANGEGVAFAAGGLILGGALLLFAVIARRKRGQNEELVK